MEFKPRALTRRLCGGKKQDNELYRSNSFKFERFERLEDSGQLTKQVSLCDDYSLPVDFVNKRRPHSFGAGPGLLNWTTPSPAGEQVEIVEAYCDPRDSKAYLEPGEEASGKVYTSPDRDYSQPYTDGSEPRTPELDEAGVYEDVGLPEDESVTLTCEDCEPVRRNPSPYYYGDLFRDGDAPPPYRKSASLDAASPAARRHVSRSSASAEGHALMPPAPRPRRQVCACAGGAQPDDAEESPSPLDEPPVDYDIDRGFFDMSGRRMHVYETAFDCRVDRSDDDLDDVDRVTNHAALHSYISKQVKQSRPGPSEASAPEERRKVTLVRGDEAALCRDLDAVEIDDSHDAPSPPSTAPLPAKFHGSNKDVRCMNSIRSAPNLPSSGPPRLKDLRLPVKSLRARDPSPGKSRGVLEFKGRSGVILEFKGRPPLTPRRCPVSVRPKYSSTESMATSSSGGSLESIRSSTSEGNRSTSSSESRRSSSLSSHSSDSGGGPRTHHHHHHHLPCITPVIGGGFFAHHQGNKLHILSPISDKSSQEPASETSDNNRNNNSQKGSPEDNTDNTVTSPPAELEPLSTKPKRRTPQNKNLVKLSLQASAESEIQGSDSGISIGWCAPELADLPFDMPKLRRRRMQMQAEAPPNAARSSDASSVDLGDLPFDMPKLRRRIRVSPESSASSSQSVRHSTGTPQLGLTLNLGNASPLRRPALSLDLAAGAAAPGGVDLSLPLERQGWYHGALSRIEAENVLRVLREGSYLVRNSESTRHDYSLSLKSARGFMHMRIQRNKESGKFILGQFSKPFDNIPEMIQHYSVNQLPIRGAEHMCLLHPVIEQLL